ncbi:hypothetical protein CU098_004372, partial [Rhizopus stolonifer]
RLVWISFAKFLTFFIPNAVLYYVAGLRTSASRIAWREKIALFTIFLSAAALLCFWLEYVSTLVCTPKKLFDYRTVFANDSKLSAIHGSVVDWSDYSSDMADFVKQYPHYDLSLDFPKFMSLSRESQYSAYNNPVLNDCIFNLNMSARADAWLDYYLNIHPGYDYRNNALLHCPMPGHPNITGAPCFGGMDVMNGYKTKGEVFYDPVSVKKYFNALPTSRNSTKKAFVILNGNVLDVAAYLLGATEIVTMSSQYSSHSFVSDRMFLPLDLTLHMYKNLGKDISTFFDRNMTENPERYRACITQLFQAGVSYNPTSCSQINPGLWATMAPESSSSLVAKSQEWPHTVLMVPCFAESSDTLKQTLDNLARSGYDDAKKLLLFVCDGVAINAEAKRETYKILLDSLGHSAKQCCAQARLALGARLGHVRPANPEENLTTMIQIFPVYMDFFTGLAYEACLRSVTTINGGLVMFKIWTEKEYPTKHYKKQRGVEQHRLTSLVKMPKISDEIIALSPFGDEHASDDADTVNSTPHATLKKTAVKIRPESNLNLVPNTSIQACCIHPTVIRGICTPQPNTMHMQNVLLLGEEKYLSIVLLTSHPGHQLGFEPDAEGYATLPSSFCSLQGLQTRNLRATFHTLLEMNRVSWRLGFRYWLVSTFALIDMIFSTPVTVYLYVIFVRSVQGFGMSYTLIACAFSGLMVIHMLVFLVRRQVKYILWFALYCILSIPIFVVWFPILALWQSDSAGTWYDVWPTASLQPCRVRTHGIIECEDTLRQNTMEDKDSDEQVTQDIARLTLSQFD